jgi:hypothetical protein
MWPEERVDGSAENPGFSMCCGHGLVQLPRHPNCPAEISVFLWEFARLVRGK